MGDGRLREMVALGGSTVGITAKVTCEPSIQRSLFPNNRDFKIQRRDGHENVA